MMPMFFSAKLTLNVNKNNLLTLRHNFSRAEQVNGTFDVPTWGISANGRETNKSNSFIGQLVTNFSSNLLNEFRFQWAKEERPRFYDGPDLPDTTIGTFDGSISYRFGRPFFLPVPSNDRRIQFTDNFTIIRGNHAIKFGVDFNASIFRKPLSGLPADATFLPEQRLPMRLPDFKIISMARVPPDFALSAICADRQPHRAGSRNASRYDVFEPGVYIQDNWQARRNLTFNLGFRWEGQFQPDPITAPANTRYGQFLSDPRVSFRWFDSRFYRRLSTAFGRFVVAGK